MEKKTFLDYDEGNDSFFLYKNKKVKGSIKAGNLIIDIDYNGNIVGLEFLDASEFFKTLKITKEMLKNAIKGSFMSETKGGWLIVRYLIMFPKNIEERHAIMIPAVSGVK